MLDFVPSFWLFESGLPALLGIIGILYLIQALFSVEIPILSSFVSTKKKSAYAFVALFLVGLFMSGALGGLFQEVGAPEEAAAPALVTVNIIDSDTNDTHVTKESDLEAYWKTEYYDNADTASYFNDDDSTLDEIKVDLDLIWSASGAVENDVAMFGIKVGTPVPVAENADDSSFDTMEIFDYDTTEDQYKITIKPSGGSTTRMEGTASVTPGGSKTVTIDANINTSDDWGLHIAQYDEVRLPILIDTNANVSDGYEETRTIRLMRVS